MSDDQGRAQAPKRTLTETWFLDDFVCRRISWCIWKVGFVWVFAYTLWGSQGGKNNIFLVYTPSCWFLLDFIVYTKSCREKQKFLVASDSFLDNFRCGADIGHFLVYTRTRWPPPPHPPRPSHLGANSPHGGAAPRAQPIGKAITKATKLIEDTGFC